MQHGRYIIRIRTYHYEHINFLKFMLYYLSQSYKIQIQNTKYVHARLPTCSPLKLKLLLTILIQERHSKVNGIRAKTPWHVFSGKYQKLRDTLFLRQPRNSNTPLVTLVLAFTYKLYIQVIHTYISHKLYKQVIEVIFFSCLFIYFFIIILTI